MNNTVSLAKKELRKRHATLVGTIAAAVARSNADLLELIAREYDLDYAEMVARYGVAASSIAAAPYYFPCV